MALYVEAERAAKELGVRKRGGFFDDNRCASRSQRLKSQSRTSAYAGGMEEAALGTGWIVEGFRLVPG